MEQATTTRELYLKLNNAEYSTYGEMEDALIQLFNEHLASMPPQYSYLNLIRWGERNNWIRRLNGHGFRIQVPAE